ncbi:hypothetical protein [Legionella fallonii]|uniref:Uncharacterized protein n=1 Tax=Legionella fallonii LLAP-10 TaxID=1212491 RepID=A0A098G4U1_9GAMM|nr:hypothetical protein [Legionella fallonii]CEG57482.1 protein of unknown function [Legionella fallonii LLAP-10]
MPVPSTGQEAQYYHTGGNKRLVIQSNQIVGYEYRDNPSDAWKKSGDPSRYNNLIQLFKQNQISSEGRYQHEQQRRKGFISSKENKINSILDDLAQKVGGIDQHYFKEAKDTAKQLLNALHGAKSNYLTNLNNLDMNIENVNEDFENTCKSLIDEARPILERDLGWGTYLTNLLKTITNAIIYVVTFGQVNNFFKQEQAESMKTVEEVEQKLKL